MPYPEVAVRPDAVRPVWLCPPKRKRKGIEPPRNLRGMPVAVPVLSDEQYALPAAVGRLFDRTILPVMCSARWLMTGVAFPREIYSVLVPSFAPFERQPTSSE